MSTMKIAMFESKEQVSDHFNRLADNVENIALPEAKVTLHNVMNGVGRNSFLKMNFLQDASDEVKEEAWQGHIKWCERRVKVLENKVKKYRKMAVIG